MPAASCSATALTIVTKTLLHEAWLRMDGKPLEFSTQAEVVGYAVQVMRGGAADRAAIAAFFILVLPGIDDLWSCYASHTKLLAGSHSSAKMRSWLIPAVQRWQLGRSSLAMC